jgi:hypothetical protein
MPGSTNGRLPVPGVRPGGRTCGQTTPANPRQRRGNEKKPAGTSAQGEPGITNHENFTDDIAIEVFNRILRERPGRER